MIQPEAGAEMATFGAPAADSAEQRANALAEARRVLEDERAARIEAFNAELEALCDKYGVRLDVESRIVLMASTRDT